MSYLPIAIDVSSGRILIVGGGRAALSKLRTLLLYTSNVFVVAPDILPEIRALGVDLLDEPYDESHLEGFSLVYACSDDRELNRRIAAEAKAKGCLVNVSDCVALSDFVSPAVFKKGDMSVAVSSNGSSARRSIAWRNAIRRKVEKGLFEDCKGSPLQDETGD